MLYFKKDLIATANQIVQAKETKDDDKALSDLLEISQILENFKTTREYDPQYVTSLNKRIRNEYPLIDKLCHLTPNGTPQRDVNNSKSYPYELVQLDTDMYGILVTVLMKKNLIKKIEDALE